MDFGVRHIRTAGKGSGSVEVTLPASLRRLVGLPCRIILDDGERPNIVLEPELSGARNAFARVWHALSFALIGEPGPDFSAAHFQFGLMPQQGQLPSPYLCWQDGLILAECSAAAVPFGKVVAACAESLACDIGISDALAKPFGAACGFLSCGEVGAPDWQEACDIASMQLVAHPCWCPGAAHLASPDTNCQYFWSLLTPGLVATTELFVAMSLPGSAYPALHTAWRRGRSIELNRG
jgi:hypothetical protein